jgi:protease PrsW
MSNEQGQAVMDVLLECTLGPDAGKRILVTQHRSVLGSGASAHVQSQDADVAHEHAAFIRPGGGGWVDALGDGLIAIESREVRSGPILPGERVRIGASYWRIADTHASAEVAGWLGNVGNKIGAAAGLSKIEGFSLWSMFSEVFKRHSDESIEEYLNAGTTTTTPALTQIQVQWPKPWLFVRLAVLAIVAYLLMVAGWAWWKNPNFLPGLMTVGAFAVPVAMLVFYMEMNIARNISMYQIIKLLIIGGTLSLVIAMVLYELPWYQSNKLGPMIAGPVEELAKLGALLLVVSRLRYRWTLNGLLLGATVGCGFAAFESAGYAFVTLINDGATAMRENIMLRGVLTLSGGHIAWTGMVGAALWKVRGQRPFRFEMLTHPMFLRTLFAAMGLHALWNMPFFGEYPWFVWPKMALVGFVSWAVVIAFVNDGLKQLRKAQADVGSDPAAPLRASNLEGSQAW